MFPSFSLQQLAIGLSLCLAASAPAAVTARFVRVENPTGCVMEWQEIEVYSGGKNIVLKQGGMFSGTGSSDADIKNREAAGITDGNKDVKLRGPTFRVDASLIDPWFEIDLGKPMAIDKIVLYGSRVFEKGKLYMDKGHRLVSALDEGRHILWAMKWNYYDKTRYPDGVFSFAPSAEKSALTGASLPANASGWVPMEWLLDAEDAPAPPDAEKRMRAFAERQSPAATEKLVALTDCEQKAKVGKATFSLLQAYGRTADARYLQRWSELMDDWSLNFFEDASRTPYEVEMLFTFSPATEWTVMMEDLAEMAAEHPESVALIPAQTLARLQLLCLEKYSTAWWRQARETVFNHETGGIYAWGAILPYFDEFRPGRRAALEWRQQFERWMTLGTEPDGSMTEIADEGHFGIQPLVGFPLAWLEQTKPDWYTPGWRNRALEHYDSIFKYIFRHSAPGGYDHRFECTYRPERWTSTTKPYFTSHPQNPGAINRDSVIFAIPEVRRLLDAYGHISSGRPSGPLQQKAHDDIAALLGAEKPGMPHLKSDWMPYTGSYYFRSGWEDDAAFLSMMACGSHGGSAGQEWPYGMFYCYDYGYPLLRAQPIAIDGMPPNQLFGRRTYQPGTKTDALTAAEQKPAAHRWHSSERFDFGEAIFRGAYQRMPSMKNAYDYRLELVPATKAIENVETSRQILQLRESRLFIVTDTMRFPPPEKAQAHQLSLPLKVDLSAKQKDPSKPFSLDQLHLDDKASSLGSENPDGPSVTLRQFSGFPIAYHRGKDAPVDLKTYAARLTPAVGIAEQEVAAEFKVAGDFALVNLIASRASGAADRIASIEPMNRSVTVAGFHAKLADGRELWYQAAAAEGEKLACGPAEAAAQALLVITGKTPGELSGMLLGGKSLTLNRRPIALKDPDFEFFSSAKAGLSFTAIRTPIDPVSFSPACNAFADSQSVTLSSRTNGVEIRYTTDGTPPTRESKLYSAPLTITVSTQFAARAYRLGADGKPVDADEFEINGTHFSAPSYGWFTKKEPKPAVEAPAKPLAAGLDYDFLQAPWWRLYASAHWIPASAHGVAEREMDLARIGPQTEPYAVRYHGYLRIPADGVYSFHAPRESISMDTAASYDLRLYIDDEEWDLTQWWHGRGTWSAPLKAGLHRFQLDFADARTTPWRKSGIWRYYPRQWATYEGKPTDILVSGPGLEAAPIPRAWFFR